MMTAVSMRPLDVLRDEHRLILEFLDSVGRAVECLQADVRPPKEYIEKALEFAGTFANVFHHIKEEDVMFARLARMKNGAIDGEIDALRYQHDRARGYLNSVEMALGGYGAGESIPTSQVLENLAAYEALLRNHIHKEDHIFYPLVEEGLSAEDEHLLHVEFENERQKAGREVFKASEELVAEMVEMLG